MQKGNNTMFNFNEFLVTNCVTMKEEEKRTIVEMMKKCALNDYISLGHKFPERAGTDGYYRMYVKDKTKKSGRRQLTAKTKKELEEKLGEYLLSLDNDAYKREHVTFSDVFKYCMQEKEKVKDKERKIAAHTTVQRNWSSYNRFIRNNEIENMNIDEIKVNHLKKCIEDNCDKYVLRKHAFAQLKECICLPFATAYQMDWLDANISEKINWKSYQKKLTVADENINNRAYSKEDIDKILESIHLQEIKYPTKMTAWACEFQILFGTRIGEVPLLTWEDVKVDGVVINKMLVRNEKKYVAVYHTKTHVDRDIFFNIYNEERQKEIQDYFERLKKVHDKYFKNSRYLFPSCDNSKYKTVTQKQIKDFFDYRIKKLGLKKEGITIGLHSFRRNAITDCLRNTNCNYIDVADNFGNSPSTIDLNYRLVKKRRV